MNSPATDHPGADSLRRRVAELLVLRASGHLSDQQRRYPQWELANSELQRLLQEGIGGVILLGGSAVELQQRTQQLQGWSDQRLLFCADVEEQPLVTPLLQLLGALLQLHGASPQQDYAADSFLQQPLELVVRKLPLGVAALRVAEMTTGT